MGGDSSQITYLDAVSFRAQESLYSFMYTPANAAQGCGLPGWNGAKIASPDRRALCILGDGAFMFAVEVSNFGIPTTDASRSEA
ncbi:thiamine pyrophosphate-dependent enzyme [Arthrobacter sp. STN4]|uniref:thiamine pyrophosphate-dependent enzyme n=1 Tax=Arthrobacter sp. STN4 TaxID=2923276 RepID=UPI0035BFA5E8